MPIEKPQVFKSFEEYQQRFGRIAVDGVLGQSPTGSAENGRAFARSFLKDLSESLAKGAPRRHSAKHQKSRKPSSK